MSGTETKTTVELGTEKEIAKGTEAETKRVNYSDSDGDRDREIKFSRRHSETQ